MNWKESYFSIGIFLVIFQGIFHVELNEILIFFFEFLEIWGKKKKL